MNYTRTEEDALATALRRGETPRCPRCAAGMDRRAVSPKSEVAYVRDRFWLVCRGCRRSALFDRRRLDD